VINERATMTDEKVIGDEGEGEVEEVEQEEVLPSSPVPGGPAETPGDPDADLED
jgi:hypothetical protein